MIKIAVIGTAGRDKTKPMTHALWVWMVQEARKRIPRDAHLISGGAAWADHLAVHLFLEGFTDRLTLHLPAPITKGVRDKEPSFFRGRYKSAASAANYYHERFSQVIGRNSIDEIVEASTWASCDGGYEPEAEGYGAMFARNAKVAAEIGPNDGLIAFTFGQDKEPDDGGTKDTWDKCKGERLHITLPTNL